MSVIATVASKDNWIDDENAHVWQQTRFLQSTTDCIPLVACRGDVPVGHWVVPTSTRTGTLHAIRSPRLLPYASPCIRAEAPHQRREIMRALFSTLTKCVSSVDLPMEPGFSDLGALNEMGGICEARHTHAVRSVWADYVPTLSPKARNHYRRASRASAVYCHADVSVFRFKDAIKDTAEVISLRREFASRLGAAGRVSVVESRIGDLVTGQLLLMRTGGWAIFMHSWFDRSNAARGTPTYLISKAMKLCFADQTITFVDVEGSIVAPVDEFLDGLGITPVIYPHLYWARERTDLTKLIDNSLNIPGRKKDAATPAATNGKPAGPIVIAPLRGVDEHVDSNDTRPGIFSSAHSENIHRPQALRRLPASQRRYHLRTRQSDGDGSCAMLETAGSRSTIDIA